MKKLRSKKGFTLMEMLIVVAIIVILVAISIPSFSGSLDKAKKATDMSNLRSAKAAAVVMEMDGGFSGPGYYYYDFTEGTFKSNGATADSVPAIASVQGSCAKHGLCHIWYDKTNRTVQWSDNSTTCD